MTCAELATRVNEWRKVHGIRDDETMVSHAELFRFERFLFAGVLYAGRPFQDLTLDEPERQHLQPWTPIAHSPSAEGAERTYDVGNVGQLGAQCRNNRGIREKRVN